MSPFEPPMDFFAERPAVVFEDAVWAALLLAVDPAGLGGIAVRAWSGPGRDAFMKNMSALFPAGTAVRKLPLGVDDGRLLGGLDIAATLAAGRPVVARGLLAEAQGGVLHIAMAERLSLGTAARLAAVMDGGAQIAMIALDEGGADEAPPAALLERLAFSVNAAGLPGTKADWPDAAQIARARGALYNVETSAETLAQICTAAALLGVASVRACLFALRAARAAAALAGRRVIEESDIALAVKLVLAPRATQMPAQPDAPAPEAPAPDHAEPRDGDAKPADETIAEAQNAALPPELLAALAAGGPRRVTRGAGAAGAAASKTRGRPAGVRPGKPGGGARLSLIETLRAAAPWQKLRQPAAGRRIAIKPEDFRIRRFKEAARTVAIFAVDASGSSAVNRLAEAKGAIQLLLADCYVRRDEVALIAFRGRGAECLLPPTHALARARRCLAGLPGGGPTPLATGIAAGRLLAEAQRRKGARPLLVLLTDGGANIGRDGQPGRAAAAADALAAGRLCRAGAIATLVVDTAPRPNSFVKTLAREMAGRYLPLPYADAARLSRAVQGGRVASATA